MLAHLKKQAGKVWSFAIPGGGGVQRACRIILGPPKHVLHLVLCAFIISTANRTALKVARRSYILRKRRPVEIRKFNCFWNGTKRKIRCPLALCHCSNMGMHDDQLTSCLTSHKLSIIWMFLCNMICLNLNLIKAKWFQLWCFLIS